MYDQFLAPSYRLFHITIFFFHVVESQVFKNHRWQIVQNRSRDKTPMTRRQHPKSQYKKCSPQPQNPKQKSQWYSIHWRFVRGIMTGYHQTQQLGVTEISLVPQAYNSYYTYIGDKKTDCCCQLIFCSNPEQLNYNILRSGCDSVRKTKCAFLPNLGQVCG